MSEPVGPGVGVVLQMPEAGPWSTPGPGTGMRGTARSQAAEQAKAAAETVALMCSGHQLLNESGIGRIFPRVQWTVVDHARRRDPSWVVVEDAADPSYLLRVTRSRRPYRGRTGYPVYRHDIRVVTRSAIPLRRWRRRGLSITRPEHLDLALGGPSNAR